ncbi:hypothetical protein BO79DRAFT_159946, partial [Aspergillus costaricaensis CBS 115574]
GVRGNGESTYFKHLVLTSWLAGQCLESTVPGACSGFHVAWFRVYCLGISLVSPRLVAFKGCSNQLLHYPTIRDSSIDRLSESLRKKEGLGIVGTKEREKAGPLRIYQSLIKLLPDRSKSTGSFSLDVFRRVSGSLHPPKWSPGSEWAWRAGTAAEKQRAWLGHGR